MTLQPLTRADALRQLEDFLPKAGADYARLRNLDLGPGRHAHVSGLSTALRRRLISEEEVVMAVLSRHGFTGAEKFISEVFWRSYWKGWLESRAALWPAYLAAVLRAQDRLSRDPALANRYADACAGRTGIDCFDGWAQEMATTGYLHNWARMQFASIWIFTLGLPWELGAAHTLARFADGDPASNTLSWRWVAGLHTVGKAYLADAERITRMTGGRYAPEGLAREAVIPPDGLPVVAASASRIPLAPDPKTPCLLLLTAEDLSPEAIPALRALPIRALACLPVETDADSMAIADARARALAVWPKIADLGVLTPDALAQLEGMQIVTPFVPVGPVADRLSGLRKSAAAVGITLAEVQRDWDRVVWPHCRKGFFALKQEIPTILAARGLA